MSKDKKCELCGAKAFFDKSPEGQHCDFCDTWICDACTDYTWMAQVAEQYNIEATTTICKECTKKKDITQKYLEEEKA